MPKPKTPKTDPYIAELENKLVETEAARLRSLADYQNLEKRMVAEKELWQSRATENVLEKLFPIFDNFYRASTYIPIINEEGVVSADELKKIRSYVSGMSMIEKQMEQKLAEVGLTRIPTKDQIFDHNLHEAVSYEVMPGIKADHIIDEVEAGWQIGDKVIRPAKVRVAQG